MLYLMNTDNHVIIVDLVQNCFKSRVISRLSRLLMNNPVTNKLIFANILMFRYFLLKR